MVKKKSLKAIPCCAPGCGKLFLPWKKSQIYCSDKCRVRTNGIKKRPANTVIGRLLIETKKVSCADCGHGYESWIMQFDHVPGRGKKLFNLSSAATLSKSIEEVSAEIGKCDVVCANCHADRTHERLMSTRIQAE